MQTNISVLDDNRKFRIQVHQLQLFITNRSNADGSGIDVILSLRAFFRALGRPNRQPITGQTGFRRIQRWGDFHRPTLKLDS